MQVNKYYIFVYKPDFPEKKIHLLNIGCEGDGFQSAKIVFSIYQTIPLNHKHSERLH